MIFNRTLTAALLAIVASTQAMSVPSTLYEREYDDMRALAARKVSERSLRHINAVRDLAYDDELLVLSARDLSSLAVRSEDVLSHFLVVRAPPKSPSPKPKSPSRSPSPGPYECKTKADCQKHITYFEAEVKKSEPIVAAAKAKLARFKKGTEDYRKAKNELHTAEEALEGYQDNVQHYTAEKAKCKS